MEWFRMYSEFASDPKVQSMSEAMQRRLMMLFCLRCSNTLVTLQDDEIAFALRISEEELSETKALFMRKNFINESWEIMNWDKRQFVSDSSSQRVARHRERQKEAKKQECNVTVTPQIQNRTDTEQIQNRTEADQIQIRSEEKPLASATAATSKKPAAPKEEPNPLNLQTWQAYKQAYTERYSVPPVRDAATNAKIKLIVKALGEEGPPVAAFFVFHNGSRYVAGMHQIGFLATDYAKLRTEWATNCRMTQTKALQADKTATNLDAFAPLIAAAKAKEEAERIANA
jgi:hypothetical protein